AARELLGGAVGAGLEVEVAEAAFAARGEERPFAVLGEVRDQLAAVHVLDDRAHREAQHDVVRALAVAVAAAAVLAALGAEDARVAVVDERVDVGVGHTPDAAATAAVAAVRTALGDILLAAEGGGAVAAFAGDDFDAGFVEEFHERQFTTEAR